MTSQLSGMFFGLKKYTEAVHSNRDQTLLLTDQETMNIFHPYTAILSSVIADDGTTLLPLFLQFLNLFYAQYCSWPLQQLSSAVQIAAHVFEHTFQSWLSKEDSFKYFSEVVVRHSLFRPPHSVCVFSLEQMKTLTKFWMSNFHRYYDQYRQCFASELKELLICKAPPILSIGERSLSGAKAASKQDVQALLK